MKAVVMSDIAKLEVKEVEKPKPKAHEVLLKVMAVGVCGSDIPRINETGSHVLPIIPGHEFAGQIVELGEDVEGFELKDKVTAAPILPCYKCEWCDKGIYALCEDYKYYGSRNDGAFAEYLAVDARNLVKLNKDTPYDWGATVDPAANAVHTFLRADVTKDDSLIVFGMGAIGLFAVQYGKAIGIKNIIAVDVNDMKLDAAKDSGANYVINGRNEDVLEKVKEFTNGEGVTVALEMSGAPIAQSQAVEVVRKRGRVVYLGISHADLNFEGHVVEKILRGEVAILGSWNSFSDPFPGFEWTESARLMDENKLNPDKIITHKLTLDDVPATFKKIAKEPFYFNKIMFYPHGK
ncbi:MAG: galactitol-1-phosphate 5-dehydrogenase [Clostridium sp.]|nr:galactitol-1-phosphate 5-dehydrogenase [Clostridium sp.]